MNPPAPSPDDQQLYTLIREFDEAVSRRSSTASLDESCAQLSAAQAAELDRLRQCVELLEDVRRQRDSKPGDTTSTSGTFTDVPRRIGRFTLYDEVGRGGCGVVFRGFDPQLDREVAIKIPRPEALVADEMRERFLREARAAGAIDHPNVVAIHEVGEDGPVCYIAAAYINGPSLSEWLRRHPQPVDPRQAVALVSILADALDQAHARGVVHRDVKPGNVLLQPHSPGEESSDLSDYVAKLTDFGLAKLHESSSGATRTGVVIGTIDYMAPEQAQGQSSNIGPATDVYGLGAILYELLTGRPPLRGETDVDTLRRIVTDDPPSLRFSRRGIPRDVEAICLKCLEKRPELRYPSAAALADDCRRFLSGQATLARPIGPARKLLRWSRRRPAIAALLLVSTSSLIALTAGSLVYNARLADALTTAEVERARAESESHTSRLLLYSADVRLAYDAWRSLNRARTLELLKRHIPAPGQQDQREFAWHWLWGQCHAELRQFTGHGDEVFQIAFSPDGTALASASKDGTARIWDAATGQQRHVLRGHEDEVTCVAFSPDGSLLATGSEDRQVILWNVAGGERIAALADHQDHVLAVAFSPDGKHLASGGRDRCVRLWDLQSRREERVLDDALDVVRSVRFSPDGKLLAACDEGGSVHRWNTERWQPLPPLAKANGHLFAIDFSPDSQRLVAAGQDYRLYCWDLEHDRVATYSSLESHDNWIRDARISSDGTKAATCNHYGLVRLWDLTKPATADDALVAAFPAHGSRAWSIAWSPDSQRLATAGADGTIRLWDAARHFEASPLERVDGWVWNIAYTQDSQTLATAHRGGEVRLWNMKSRKSVASHDLASDWSRFIVAMDGAGKRMACGTSAGDVVRYVDLETDEVLFEFADYAGKLAALDISSDGRRLAIASDSTAATILELPSGHPIHRLVHTSPVTSLDISSDGKKLVTGSRELRVWDLETGTSEWGRRYKEVNPFGAVFAPDRRTIAVWIGGETVAIVDASNGDLLEAMFNRRGNASALAFSPDGRTLAMSLARDSAIVLWDVRTHQELCHFDTGMAHTMAIAFSPDGRRLAAAGQHAEPQKSSAGTGRVVEWSLREPPAK